MNWDNQNNQDPWGRKDQDEVSFDDLIKKFSVMFGKQGSGSNGSSGGGGFNFPTKRAFLYGFFGLLVLYASMSIYQLDSPERAVVLRFGEYHAETGEGLNFMLAGIDERYVENVALTRRYSQTANMLTKDENLVDVTISVQYRRKMIDTDEYIEMWNDHLLGSEGVQDLMNVLIAEVIHLREQFRLAYDWVDYQLPDGGMRDFAKYIGEEEE